MSAVKFSSLLVARVLKNKALIELSQERAVSKPTKVARVVARILLNFVSHARVVALMRSPVMAEAAQLYPRMRFKHLTDDFLARDLGVPDRVRCYTHHHRRLLDALEHGFVRGIIVGHETIWSLEAGENQLRIDLGLSIDYDKEGEHSLQLRCNGEVVYLVSFTIVPGCVVGCPAREVALISRLQGAKGHSRLLSCACRVLDDMPAPIALVTALCGICRALGVEALACVSAENQTAYMTEYDAVFRKAYDGLMDALGVKRNERGYFVSTLPLPHKPMSEIKEGHKVRTKRKRRKRCEIEDDCAAYIARNMRNDRPA